MKYSSLVSLFLSALLAVSSASSLAGHCSGDDHDHDSKEETHSD